MIVFTACLPGSEEDGATTTSQSATSNNQTVPFGNDNQVNIIPNSQNTQNINNNNNNNNNTNNNSGSNLHPYYQENGTTHNHFSNPGDGGNTTTTPLPEFNPTWGGHLEYFGYYWSAINEKPILISEDGESYTEEADAINYMDEYQDHTNLSWLHSGFPGFKEQMDLAKFYNQKVVIDISAQVFIDHSGQNPGLYFNENYDDLRNRLNNWWQNNIVAHGFEDMIFFLTPADEPYHHFADKFWTWDENDSIKKMNRHLNRLADIIKQVTGAKVGLSFNPKFASKDKVKLNDTFDFLGFYCYTNMSRCHSYRTWYGVKIYYSLADLVNQLELKTPGGRQNWFLIGPSFQIHSNNKSLSESENIAQFNRMYNYAKSNRRVQALIPFIWRSYREGENLEKLRTGARQMPNLRSRLIEIGKEIID